jgi:hypothetical protein
VSAEEALAKAEELYRRVEDARKRLEQTDDTAQAIEILSEISDLAREVENELSRARRAAEAEADAGF